MTRGFFLFKKGNRILIGLASLPSIYSTKPIAVCYEQRLTCTALPH